MSKKRTTCVAAALATSLALSGCATPISLISYALPGRESQDETPRGVAESEEKSLESTPETEVTTESSPEDIDYKEILGDDWNPEDHAENEEKNGIKYRAVDPSETPDFFGVYVSDFINPCEYVTIEDVQKYGYKQEESMQPHGIRTCSFLRKVPNGDNGGLVLNGNSTAVLPDGEQQGTSGLDGNSPIDVMPGAKVKEPSAGSNNCGVEVITVRGTFSAHVFDYTSGEENRAKLCTIADEFVRKIYSGAGSPPLATQTMEEILHEELLPEGLLDEYVG